MENENKIEDREIDEKIDGFEVSRLIQDSLIVNGVFLLIVALQYLFIPLANQVIFIGQSFFIYLFFLCSLISFILAKFYYTKIAIVFNLLWLLVNFALSLLVLLFFSGSLTMYLNILAIILIVLSRVAMSVNFHLLSKKFRARHLVRRKSAQLSKKIAIFVTFLVIVVSIGVGSFQSWNKTYVIQADSDFNTISSYWGPPAYNKTTVIRKITPLDNSTLIVNNSTLNETVDNFGENSLCYLNYVNTTNVSINYCNYQVNATSFPNGTVHLSQPLPEVNSSIIVKFTFVKEISVFADLNTSKSTLIMNFLNENDDFVEYPNYFYRIERTHLFLLLDTWDIKYYLDVGISSLLFPHVFNYPEFVARCNQTIDWINQATLGPNGPPALSKLIGISVDFESSDKDVPEFQPLQNPAFQPLLTAFPYSDWIGNNEQNRTLYAEAVQAYEYVYDYCVESGYKFYVVFQGNAMMEIMDGDLDTTRLPTYPISPHPEVLYGIMSYHDSNAETGDYDIYKNCINQMKLYGEQGNTILTGWISPSGTYYTNDEQGFQNYLRHCKIAQAAGIVEIFHAPLYRMQKKWGNDAILRLHYELNNETKEEITIQAPRVWDYNPDYMNDYIQNFDRLELFIPMLIFIGLQIVFNTFGLYRKTKSKRKPNI